MELLKDCLKTQFVDDLGKRHQLRYRAFRRRVPEEGKWQMELYGVEIRVFSEDETPEAQRLFEDVAQTEKTVCSLLEKLREYAVTPEEFPCVAKDFLAIL